MIQKIFKEFIEKTRDDLSIRPRRSDLYKGVPPPPLELGYDETKRVIDLPSQKDIRVDAIDLREAIEKRRSFRNYTEQMLTLEELSWLLWCTQGVKEIVDRPQGVSHPTRATLRVVPSSGACHPFETYLLVNRVKGLQSGLYRFLAIKHKLVEVSLEEGLADKITEVCWGQQFVKRSAAVFIWTFLPYRTTWRYGARGLRALMEAGHICQNLYLSAEAIHCGVCAVDAFGDNEFNAILGIDGEDQFIVYIATVGKKR